MLNHLVANGSIVGDINYHVQMGTELLFMQIRAINSFTRIGDWSDPILLLNATSETSTPPAGDKRGVWIYVIVGALSVLLVVLVVVVCACVYWHFCFHRHIKYENAIMMDQLTGDYIPPSFIPVADEWELQWEDIEIFYGEELGTGAFGRVFRGILHSRQLRDMVNGDARSSRRGSFGRRRGSRRPSTNKPVGSHVVAVKRLKDNISGPDKANFLREIEMMKTVSGSRHDHQRFVVNMLGCVITQEPMMLVLEYATHGDLLSYLRDSRVGDGTSAATNSKAAPYLEPKGAYSQLPPRNSSGEEKQEEEEEEDRKLTEKDLLSFARQIAAGMGFLSSLSVVHRDLACRNILVCDNRLVKISDFGLSRSLVNEEAYVTTTKGVLPIRWMAPEALFYRTFDTQSDVWSFGILLWEIYTLGGYPYPTKSNRDILELLTVGYRMDKPEICEDEVYHVMLQCWNSLGVQRPTFDDLYVTFDNLLARTTRQQSPYVQVLGAAYYDQLGPVRQQTDQDPLDLESVVPANVDTRQHHDAATPHPRLHESRSLQEPGNGFLNRSGQGAGQSASPHSQEVNRGRIPANLRGSHNQDSRLGVPLPFSRPQSWVGGPSAELGPRYVPTPLHLTSGRSSMSNLTEETAFGSSIVTVTSENRLAALPTAQSRSAGNIPLLTNSNVIVNTHTNL
jgi:serine/threonine protein kinase